MEKLIDILSVGTWVLIPYGFEMSEFCVLDKTEKKVLLGEPSWCVSDAEWFSIDRLEQEDGTVLGRGEYRWWRLILPFINDVIFPYSKYRHKEVQMEMVLCKKYTGRIELPVAAQYYDDSNVCRSCFSFDLCKEKVEEEERGERDGVDKH